jgi:ATP-binding cassette, subfamily B, bacterial
VLRGFFGRFTTSGGQGERSALVTLQAFLPFVRPHWHGFVPALIGVIAVSLVALLKPWPLGFLINNVLQVGQADPNEQASPTVLILAVAGAIVGIAALQGLFNYLKEFFLSATSQRVAFSVRRALFAHMQRLSLTFHDRQRTGDMITRVTSDVTKVQELVTDKLLVDGISSVLQFVGMLTVMFVIDWRIGLIATAWAPLVVIASTYFRRRIRDEEQHVRVREGDFTSLTQETISSIRVVKAFARERFAEERFAEQTGEMAERNVNVARLEARFGWVMTILTGGGMATVVAFGAQQVLAGALSAGTLVVFAQYMKDLQSPLNTLSRLWAKLAKVAVRAERIMEVFDERPAVEERPGAKTAPRFRGEVRFEGVSFGYDPKQPVLRDIELEILPGEVAAVVGATGAGKSTLSSLILRLYDPVKGSVLIDGRDVRDYKPDSLVEQIGVVLQESLLFQTTIRENIAYGNPKATFEEIQEAARLAYCEDFIRNLPKGFDTVVGERGSTLSGGQRQRIAIARAVIRDAPILILDEPTTGLDAESEEIVMRALERLMKGRTTLMIAHKLSTVRRADRIYVLEEGEIAEEGTHEELTARGGAYERAVRLQTIPGQDVG